MCALSLRGLGRADRADRRFPIASARAGPRPCTSAQDRADEVRGPLAAAVPLSDGVVPGPHRWPRTSGGASARGVLPAVSHADEAQVPGWNGDRGGPVCDGRPAGGEGARAHAGRRGARMKDFPQVFGGTPEACGDAPGRVNLLGEHTDYSEGFVLPTSIDQRTRVALRRSRDPVFIVYSANLDTNARFTLDTPPSEPFARYVYGCVRELAE